MVVNEHWNSLPQWWWAWHCFMSLGWEQLPFWVMCLYSITVRKSMVIQPFLALGRRMLSPIPESDQGCNGGRARRDEDLGWHKALRARSVTRYHAAGAEVCCRAHLGTTPWLLPFHSGGHRHCGKLVFVLPWTCGWESQGLVYVFRLILLILFRLHEVYT